MEQHEVFLHIKTQPALLPHSTMALRCSSMRSVCAPAQLRCVAARRSASRSGAVRVAAAGKAYTLTLLPGDGIGPEIMKVAVDCLNVVVRGS